MKYFDDKMQIDDNEEEKEYEFTCKKNILLYHIDDLYTKLKEEPEKPKYMLGIYDPGEEFKELLIDS